MESRKRFAQIFNIWEISPAVGCWYAHALPKSARGSRFSALGLMWHPLVGKKHYRILLAPFHGALGGPYNPSFLYMAIPMRIWNSQNFNIWEIRPCFGRRLNVL